MCLSTYQLPSLIKADCLRYLYQAFWCTFSCENSISGLVKTGYFLLNILLLRYCTDLQSDTYWMFLFWNLTASAEIGIKHVYKAMNSTRIKRQDPGELQQVTACLFQRGLLDFENASANCRNLFSQKRKCSGYLCKLARKYIISPKRQWTVKTRKYMVGSHFPFLQKTKLEESKGMLMPVVLKN